MPAKVDVGEGAKVAPEDPEYDAWFRLEVQRAVKEADDPATKWLTNEEVKKLSAEHRALWRSAAARKT